MDNTQDQKRQDSYVDRLNSGAKNLRRLNRITKIGRVAVAVIQSINPIVLGIAAFFGFLLLLAVIIIVIFAPPPVGQPPLCTSTPPGGSCQVSCASPLTQDTSGAECRGPDAGKICCVPQAQCIGSCESGNSCKNSKDDIDTTAFCSGVPNQICCVPPGTQPPLHFYCQYDKQYSGGACNIAATGCDPTSIAMIITSFGNTYNPRQVGLTNGIGCTGATTFAQTRNTLYNWVAPMGYTISPIGVSSGQVNVASIKNRIDAGYYIIALACMTFESGGTLKTGGHSIVIAGVNADGSLKVADPTFCRSDTNYRLRDLNSTYPGPDIRSNCMGKDGTVWGGWGALYAVKK